MFNKKVIKSYIQFTTQTVLLVSFFPLGHEQLLADEPWKNNFLSLKMSLFLFKAINNFIIQIMISHIKAILARHYTF